MLGKCELFITRSITLRIDDSYCIRIFLRRFYLYTCFIRLFHYSYCRLCYFKIWLCYFFRTSLNNFWCHYFCSLRRSCLSNFTGVWIYNITCSYCFTSSFPLSNYFLCSFFKSWIIFIGRCYRNFSYIIFLFCSNFYYFFFWFCSDSCWFSFRYTSIRIYNVRCCCNNFSVFTFCFCCSFSFWFCWICFVTYWFFNWCFFDFRFCS
ncbi:NADH dehydrogenase subunit 5 [Streptococcus mitis]|uniref:NADH dehydrogenase subunit 5 n=1 Tax=Streptococcus mitis TaxID=28037 RepID=A0A139PQX4_STRMT|nr:NADH dehydrogenase subunit 5 [Streptococcus mitis]